jgi:cell wall-associated NlpC family hydrolase
MRTVGKFGFAALLAAVGLCSAYAQKATSSIGGANPVLQSTGDEETSHSRSLTDDDRLSLIAAALDSRARSTETDCSHLVHAIYAQAGLNYSYAPSSDLYAGIDGFQLVKKPEPGDLVVWRGHAGIVIKPSQHIFFSVLSTGPGIDDYTTSYWKHRGKARFYRYVKSGKQRHLPQLVRTNRGHRANSDLDDEQ